MIKTMLITGAGAGIGAATAIKAAKQGYSLCINYSSNSERAQQLQKTVESYGIKAFTHQADISNEEEAIGLFGRIDEEFGQLDVLVNNAGVIATMNSIEAVTEARLQRLFSINVFGSFYCAREAVKRMSTAKGGNGGSIINVSSIASRLGSPNEFIDYAATKGAIDTFTIGLAKEVADQGVRVNAVRPGLIATDMHTHAGDSLRAEKLKAHIPMKRVGVAEEVANTILWLCSEEASYVTGSLLDVSGGR